MLLLFSGNGWKHDSAGKSVQVLDAGLPAEMQVGATQRSDVCSSSKPLDAFGLHVSLLTSLQLVSSYGFVQSRGGWLI